MSGAVIGLTALSLVIWVYLTIFHGRFWRADQRLAATARSPDTWPEVAAVVPARNEAPFVGAAIASLLRQDYPGRLTLVLVDDDSTDGTAAAGRRAAAAAGSADRLHVVRTAAPGPGWTGKLWAVSQGLARADVVAPQARFVLLSDADIVHAPSTLRRLVAKASGDGLDLVSLMVLLSCEGFWERVLVPAFVFFFQKLYPFPRVNHPDGSRAGAAGGCMLVRRAALDRAGGIAAIRGELIDDCALARLIKRRGPIWLGLAEVSRSTRPYGGIGGIWHMVRRTAYAQLGHSPLLLAGTVLGMVLIYLVPPAGAIDGLIVGSPLPAALGLAAWSIMASVYLPTLRLYGRPAAEALLLPLAGVVYTLITLDSARSHRDGRGGDWKGRTYPAAAHRGRRNGPLAGRPPPG